MSETAPTRGPDEPPCHTLCPLCLGLPAAAGAMRWRPTSPAEAERLLASWTP